MQTQEKHRIFTQLKSLRQQSLTEYLGTNLRSLANHEVIEDILSKFISTHEDQFLTNVSNSIVEVKEQYRVIKKQLKEKQEQENLVKLKIENQLAAKYEAEMEQFFNKWLELQQLSFEKSAEKNPSKAIKKLFDELQSQKAKNNQKIQSLKSTNQSLSQELSSKQNEIKTLSQELNTLKNHLTLINESLDSKELLNKSLEEQIYQKHIKLEETMAMTKGMEERLVNSKEMMDFLEKKACTMREENVRLKHQIEMMEKEKEKVDSILENCKKQCENLKNQKNIAEEKQRQNQKKANESIESLKAQVKRMQGDNTQLFNQISSLQTQIQSLQDKLMQSQKSIEKASNQKAELSTERQKLQTELQKIKIQLNQSLIQLESSTQQKQALVKQIQQKEVMMKNYLDEKDQQIKVIEQELKQLKEQVEQKQEQEKQYELYLEEIVELRQKIKYLTPAKYESTLQTDCFGRPTKFTNKRTKIYFLLTQIQNKFIQIKTQRTELLKFTNQQIHDMKDYINKVIGFLMAKSMEVKMKCEYCQLARGFNAARTNGIAKNAGYYQSRAHNEMNGEKLFTYEQEMQKTREFSYKPSNILSQNNQNQSSLIKSPLYIETTLTKPSGSRGITKNLRHLNQKMKSINQENSIYQMHLSRLLSDSSLQ